ncbi:hypothetical protein SB6421_05517 [Klebsiella huaxiensis]|nr:hypothetical protein SB6425_03496 [Klebsiella huaxiensis]VUT13672.1 hypothetical protein SB6421_05517 [Klebsiella huaxiensis]
MLYNAETTISDLMETCTQVSCLQLAWDASTGSVYE